MDTFSSDVKVVNLMMTSPREDDIDRRSLLTIISDLARDSKIWF